VTLRTAVIGTVQVLPLGVGQPTHDTNVDSFGSAVAVSVTVWP
jgi:hypothetical protein